MKTKRRLPIIFRALICIVLTLCALSAISFIFPSRMPLLTAEERQWISENSGKITIGIYDAPPPIGFFDGAGNWIGISSEYISLIEQKTGIVFDRRFVRGSTNGFDSIFNKVDVKCDFKNSNDGDPERFFSSPYIELPNAIIVRKGTRKYMSFSDLTGLMVTAVNGGDVHTLLKDKHPEIDLDTVFSDLEGLRKVAFHQSDVMICNLATASYIIEKEGFTNLRMAGTIGKPIQLCFSTRKDLLILYKIIEKGLSQITENEHQEIHNKWIHLDRNFLYFRKEFWYWLSACGFILVAANAFAVVWNRVLKRQVSQRTRQLEDELCERRKMEHRLLQTQKMEALGTFAGGIAHDFNNTLGTVIGYAEMMEMFDTQTGSRSEKRLTHILNAAYRGKGLVRQILTFCRRSEQEKLPVFINPIVRETLDFLRAGIPSTIEIVKTDSCGADAVYADPTHIHQLLMNLAANAVQAMGAGGGRLEVALCESEQAPAEANRVLDPGPGPYICIRVSDTGCGMTPETLEHIFEPFYTTKKAGAGTGMGLSVVHGIVKDLGGTIRVETRPDAGSVFEVYLPRYSGDIARIEKQAAAGPLLRGAVLFVDDDQDQTDFVRDILSELGCEVRVSSSGFEALAIFRSDPGRYDLVITDQVMPQITGMELASKMLAIRPDVSIVLCSGYSPGLSAEDVSAAGMRAFVKKPLGAYDLIDIVRKYLAKPDILENRNGQCPDH